MNQTKRIHRKLSQQHKELIRVLDAIELQTLPTGGKIESSTMVAIELTSFERIAHLASHMYENDRNLAKVFENLQIVKSSKQKRLKIIQQELKRLTRQSEAVRLTLKIESEQTNKDIKHVMSILKEFRERCRNDIIDYMKEQDLELRKILKPLVPSTVLDEHIKYEKINLVPSLINSLDGTQQAEVPAMYSANATSTLDSNGVTDEEEPEQRMNDHLNMLVSTLENVAKSLILMLNDVNRKYYEYVDPTALDTDPPTPLAAPLPEYFCYEAKDWNADDSDSENVLHNEAKNRLVKKLIELQNKSLSGVLTPEKAGELRRRLQKILDRDVTNSDLQLLFNEFNISIDQREELVFNIIDSGRPGTRDVTLNEILGSERNCQRRSLDSDAGCYTEPDYENISISSQFRKQPGGLQLPTEMSYMTPNHDLGPKSVPMQKPSAEMFSRKRKSIPGVKPVMKSGNSKPVIGSKKVEVGNRAVTPSHRRKYSPARKLQWLKRRKSIGKQQNMIKTRQLRLQHLVSSQKQSPRACLGIRSCIYKGRSLAGTQIESRAVGQIL